MPAFLDALTQHPTCRAFRVEDHSSTLLVDWELTPIHAPVLAGQRLEGFYLLAAFQIVSETDIRNCFLDLHMPECWSEHAYFLKNGKLRRKLCRELPGDLIPAISIESHYRYEAYYSKIAPRVGIGVLQRGLVQATQKGMIASNLAYIYRDENRVLDAIQMFEVALQSESVVNEYYCVELVGLYHSLGDTANEDKYAKLAPSHWIPGRDYFPKCEPHSMFFPIGLPEHHSVELLQVAERSPELRSLAFGIARSPDLDGLYALADALEESGYIEEKVLSHLRGNYHPPESCLVLDWMLGKVTGK